MNKMRYGKRITRCRVCWAAGHNSVGCPEVDRLAEEWHAINNGTSLVKLRYDHAAAIREQRKRKDREAKKIAKKALSKPRRKSRCSFCSETGHNRRNCTELTKVQTLFAKANIAWKRKFASAIKEAGYGVGALVSLTIDSWGEDRKKKIPAIINSFPLPDMNFMCAYAGSWDFVTNTQLQITTTNGEDTFMNEGTDSFHCMVGDEEPRLFKKLRPWRDDLTPFELLHASYTPLPSEWVESEEDKSISWLLKNNSLSEFKWHSIMKHAETWAALY
tara:strand:- start:499 stop:1320 length:822 start_codon:yes stop_codon:yes gene_type:complete